jgi:hypothetical protein
MLWYFATLCQRDGSLPTDEINNNSADDSRNVDKGHHWMVSGDGVSQRLSNC